jgi:RNA polymerase sigma factor (sigma-70 family)
LSQEYIKDKSSKLVELCKVGNSLAQREIYNLYVKAMFNTALRIVGDREEAEDVIQESFLDGFMKIDMFRGDSTFGAWLKSIVVNKSIAKLRSRKIVIEEIDDRMESSLTYVDEEDLEDKLEMIDKIKRVITSLPNGFRLVLNLYLFEGYDHQEIGEILGISEVTSRSQYIRGKSKLLELLKVTQ